jgi:hypothetical protein
MEDEWLLEGYMKREVSFELTMICQFTDIQELPGRHPSCHDITGGRE